MNILKEIEKEESKKGSLVENWHNQELEYFINGLIKKDRAEQLILSGVGRRRESLNAFANYYNNKADRLDSALDIEEKHLNDFESI